MTPTSARHFRPPEDLSRASRLAAITMPIASTQLGTSRTVSRPLSAIDSSSGVGRRSRPCGVRPASSTPRNSSPSSSSSKRPATGAKSSRRLPRSDRFPEREESSTRRRPDSRLESRRGAADRESSLPRRRRRPRRSPSTLFAECSCSVCPGSVRLDVIGRGVAP